LKRKPRDFDRHLGGRKYRGIIFQQHANDPHLAASETQIDNEKQPAKTSKAPPRAMEHIAVV
jgi:hypothetical protein